MNVGSLSACLPGGTAPNHNGAVNEDVGPNAYSPAWFEFFHVGTPAARTELETAFIRQFCPLPHFTRVLDVCCGMGRHARALAAAGYVVTGVERDTVAVTIARERGGGPVYIQADVRDYRPEAASFSAAFIMSQSFGYFDPETNRDLLARLRDALRPGGRLLLDLWNPDFFLPRQGQRTFQSPRGAVQETTRVEGGRLFSRLNYPDGGYDAFEFQMFSPVAMEQLTRPLGLQLTVVCVDYDAALPPSADKPKMQFVLERVGS